MNARAFIWKLHTWLGLISCLGLLLWAGSGLLHPIMSRTQPVPAQRQAPLQGVDLSKAMPLATALQQHGITHISQAELATIRGQNYYRVQLPSQTEAVYLHSQTGQPLIQGDARYAEQLARHYTALADTPVRSVRLLRQFENDYPAVNKLLPVWRVEFARDDGLRAFVDTSQARLAGLSDSRQSILMGIFRIAHTWIFLDNSPYLQAGLMLLLLACLLFSALSGLYFYVRLQPSAAQRLQNRPLTRWHRKLGLLVSLMLLMAVGSGAYHLLHDLRTEAATPPPLPAFATAEMTEHSWMGVSTQPLAQFGLARLAGQMVWVIRPAPADQAAPSGPQAQVAHLAQMASVEQQASDEHAEHAGHKEQMKNGAMGAESTKASSALALDEHGIPIDQGQTQIARDLAVHYTGLPANSIVSTREVTHFGSEYGFFNKRLPVWRVEFADTARTRAFVEPATGALAARMDTSDAREGWSFITLHKWHFIPGGTNIRDAILAFFAFGNLLVAAMGLWLFLRRH